VSVQPFLKERHRALERSPWRCAMRFSGLVGIIGGLQFPFALFAQHTAPPAPSHVGPAVGNFSSGLSGGLHTSNTPPSRVPAAGSATGSQRFHTDAKTTANSKATVMQGVEVKKSSPERRGPFSFLGRREPTSQADLRNKCTHGRCSTKNTTTPVRVRTRLAAVAPAPSEARRGCMVVPVTNPAVPCNLLAPCCP